MNVKQLIFVSYLMCCPFTATGFSLVNISKYPIKVEIFGEKKERGMLKKRGAELNLGEVGLLLEHKKLTPKTASSAWYNVNLNPQWATIYITAEGSTLNITDLIKKNKNSIFELDAGTVLFLGKREISMFSKDRVGIRRVVKNLDRYPKHTQRGM